MVLVVFTGFYAVGSMEWNEFRIDRHESWRGQVSCPGCRESSLLDVERREDNFLQVSYTGSPLRPHAQITCRHTEWLQASLPIQDLLFFLHKKIRRVVWASWFDWFVSTALETTPRGVFLFLFCAGVSLVHCPDAYQDIAVTFSLQSVYYCGDMMQRILLRP